MIKNVEDTSDVFFPDLSRWITGYGMAFMIVLLASLITAAGFIRYTDKEVFTVIIEKDRQYVEIGFSAYRNLKNNQQITISGPFDHAVTGYIKKTILTAKDSYVTIPVIITDTALLRLPISGQIKCQGLYEKTGGSLLSNLMKAR
jgi:hypothetical protein